MARTATRRILCIALAVAAYAAAPANAQVVISQVYGGGGNTSAPFNADYVELFNAGTTPASLNGWSIQYASATGTGNLGANATQLTELPDVTLQPGQYFLVQEASGATGSALPLPNFVDPTPIAMAAGAGKVALVAGTASLGCNGSASSSTPCGPAQLALILDLVGYGNANFFEGAGAAPTLSNTTVALRAGAGCTDSNNNNLDFPAPAPAPAPRTTTSTLAPCGGGGSTSPTGSGLATPSSVTAGGTSLLTVAVTPGTNPASTQLSVSADLTTIGGAASQPFFDDGSNGDVAPNDNTFSYGATVGALVGAGTKTLVATVADQARSTTTNISLTVTAPITCTPTTTIAAVQGAGPASPLVGQTVSTQGIVTAIRTNGFYIQMPAGDGSDLTSDGVFVFTRTAPLAAAAAGNEVCVTGLVTEFVPAADPFSPSLTEISGTGAGASFVPPTYLAVSTGNALPAPVTINAAASTLTRLESLEGMRVAVAALTVVGGTLGSVTESSATSLGSGVFYGVVAGVARPFREPGIDANDPPPPCAAPVQTDCVIPVFDTNVERLRIDSGGLGQPRLNVSAGVTVSGLVGPLDYAFRTYTILADAPPAPAPVATGEPVFRAVPAPLAADITVGSWNLERFFDTTDDGSTSDPVLTADAFDRRLNKASLTIRQVLRLPDVLGVVEVENLATLTALAARVNADAATDGSPAPVYTAHLVEGNDIGGIDVGFLVKSSKIAVEGVEQLGKDATYIDPTNGQPATLNDRPSLLLRASAVRPGGATFRFAVIVNHLRSFIDIDSTDPSGGATVGARVREKRRAQAEFLANEVQALQAAEPNLRILLVGDFNAFQFNDGYVDSIGTIRGATAPPAQVTLASADLVTPDLVNLAGLLPASERYSYVFDGNAQILDHAIANMAVLPWVSRVAYSRSNADFAEERRNDPTRPERLSDHDAVMAYLSIGQPNISVGVAAAGTRLDLTLRNEGGGIASEIVVDGVIVVGLGLRGGPVAITNVDFPLPVGTISPGASLTVPLQLGSTRANRFLVIELGHYRDSSGGLRFFADTQIVER